jgi:hypothetical protein
MANGEKNESKYDTMKEYDSSHNHDQYAHLPANIAEEAKKTDKGKEK